MRTANIPPNIVALSSASQHTACNVAAGAFVEAPLGLDSNISQQDYGAKTLEDSCSRESPPGIEPTYLQNSNLYSLETVVNSEDDLLDTDYSSFEYRRDTIISLIDDTVDKMEALAGGK